MSNIDDKLAFGEHVLLPIRMEKTADQKWIELGKYVKGQLDKTWEIYKNHSDAQMVDDEAYWLQEMCDTLYDILLKMDELDT